MATVTLPRSNSNRLLNLFRRTDGIDRRLVGPIRGEVLGADRLAKHARNIARKHRLLSPKKQRGSGPLLLRLDDSRRVLDEIRDRLTEAAERGVDISPAGEWLLDNAYIVQEHIREIRTNLPGGYYQELPKLANGTLAEYPRVYDVAIELIAHTEGHLSLENITLFVREYQKVSTLKIGELWAIPTMLRLGLVENIRRMTLRVSARLDEVELSDRWAERLMAANEKSPAALTIELASFIDGHPPFTPTFVTRFLQQIRGYQANFTPLIWLEQWIGEDGPTAEEAVTAVESPDCGDAGDGRQLHHQSAHDCPPRLEGLRRVAERDGKILRKDITGYYAKMSFATRDQYRHVVENIAKRTKLSEEDIANGALGLAAVSGVKAIAHESHIGYYLVSDGRYELERETGYLPPLGERIYRWTQRKPERALLRKHNSRHSRCACGDVLGGTPGCPRRRCIAVPGAAPGERDRNQHRESARHDADSASWPSEAGIPRRRNPR